MCYIQQRPCSLSDRKHACPATPLEPKRKENAYIQQRPCGLNVMKMRTQINKNETGSRSVKRESIFNLLASRTPFRGSFGSPVGPRKDVRAFWPHNRDKRLQWQVLDGELKRGFAILEGFWRRSIFCSFRSAKSHPKSAQREPKRRPLEAKKSAYAEMHGMYPTGVPYLSTK